MGNFTATRPHVYVAGAVILAANHEDNENTVYTAHNGAIHATTGHAHTGGSGDGPKLTAANVNIVDAGGFFTATNVETALQELFSREVSLTVSVAASVWTITHNFNSLLHSIDAYDANGVNIGGEIDRGLNSSTVTFLGNKTGFVLAKKYN